MRLPGRVYKTFPPPRPFPMSPSPELAIRELHAHLDIKSILDVGTGFGGVFDQGYWEAKKMEKRACCDVFAMKDMNPLWERKLGVDVRELTEHYSVGSFDFVQCMEVLEHVSECQRAVNQLVLVARKLVIITTSDEACHLGDGQALAERVNPHQRFRRMTGSMFFRKRGWAVGVEPGGHQIIAWIYL